MSIILNAFSMYALCLNILLYPYKHCKIREIFFPEITIILVIFEFLNENWT